MKKVPKQVHTDNVYSQLSRIPNGGMGLFAKVDIPQGKKICTYAGRLYDSTEAAYRDPTYIVNFELGKGYKLDGDGVDGDFGHFANATQINADGIADPPMNARFCMKSKKQWEEIDEKTGESYFRGRFDLVARKDIRAHDEIILDYGKGYWLTMENYWKHGPPPRSDIDAARDVRAKRRLQRFQLQSTTTKSKVEPAKNSSIATDEAPTDRIHSPRLSRKRKLSEKALEYAILIEQNKRKRAKSILTSPLPCANTDTQSSKLLRAAKITANTSIESKTPRKNTYKTPPTSKSRETITEQPSCKPTKSTTTKNVLSASTRRRSNAGHQPKVARGSKRNA